MQMQWSRCLATSVQARIACRPMPVRPVGAAPTPAGGGGSMSDGSAVSFPLSISCLATHAAERLCRSGRERNYRREPGNGGGGGGGERGGGGGSAATKG